MSVIDKLALIYTVRVLIVVVDFRLGRIEYSVYLAGLLLTQRKENKRTNRHDRIDDQNRKNDHENRAESKKKVAFIS